jgi:hypothetical protein
LAQPGKTITFRRKDRFSRMLIEAASRSPHRIVRME